MTPPLFGLLCAALVLVVLLYRPVRDWFAERRERQAWQAQTDQWKAEHDARNPPGPPLTEAEITAIKDWFPAHALPAVELRPDADAPIRADGCRLGGPAWVADGAD